MKVGYRCPSNIALVKYWGKKAGGVQLPANPSVSWSLGDLYASTTVVLEPKSAMLESKSAILDLASAILDTASVILDTESAMPESKSANTPVKFIFTFDGKSKPSFEPKIAAFLSKISADCLWLNDYTLIIDSVNNFPHGTGIASSAAGFGALSLCIAHLEQCLLGATDLSAQVQGMDFWQRSSYLSRMGSGSACRSMYSQPAVWGESDAVAGSSDLYAVEMGVEVHADLLGWKDVVLIVDDGEKLVSSTAGHALLENHPYALSRFGKAQENLASIVGAMRDGDVPQFIAIVESEALQLHSMMMTSLPYYVLMRPNTLAIIEKIWQFRNEMKMPICFTLDAGANVHLLFDAKVESTVMNFVNNTLLTYCKNDQYLCSETGKRPILMH